MAASLSSSGSCYIDVSDPIPQMSTLTPFTALIPETSRPLSDYEKISYIGEGGSGIVYKAKDKTSKQIVALKKLKISNELESLSQNCLREVTQLKLLQHNNIVKLIDIATDVHDTACICLVLEHCKYVLSTVVDDDPSLLLHPQIKNIMRQLFSGLDYIHKNSIVHRDLNPSNILFSEAGILKISDFNSSRKVSEENATPNVGTLWYRAPEILFGSVHYTLSVDMWSAGCVLAEMLLKRALFRGDSHFEVLKLMIDFLGSPTESSWPGHSNLPFLQHYDLQIQPISKVESTFSCETAATISLIQDLLSYNPSSRSSAELCLKHLYFEESPAECTLDELTHVLEKSESI